MAPAQRLISWLPPSLRPIVVRYREMVKFGVVGGICFVVTGVTNYGLKLTVFEHRPVTAFTIATSVATVVSYLLNRGWSFRTRGGRAGHHEAVLFFVVSGLAVGVADLPLAAARYVFDLRVPNISRSAQEISDFVGSMILGTLVAMVFRWWALRRWVFPKAAVGRRSVISRPRTQEAEPEDDHAKSARVA